MGKSHGKTAEKASGTEGFPALQEYKVWVDFRLINEAELQWMDRIKKVQEKNCEFVFVLILVSLGKP